MIVFVVGLGIAFWIHRRGNTFYSDPNLGRTNAVYDALFVSPASAPDIPTNSSIFGAISVETNGTHIEISMPQNIGGKAPLLPFSLHRAKESGEASVGEGTIRLAYLLAGWAAPLTNFDYSVRVPAKIYDAQARPMSWETVKLDRWDRELQARGDFPSAKYFFQVTNVPEFKLLRFQTFDARTRMSLNSGTASSYTKEAFWVEADVRLWHQTPIELVSTVAVGPSQTFETKPEVGNELRFPGGALKLIYVVPERINGWGSSSNGKTNTATLNLNADAVVGYTNESSFVFYVWPTTTDLPIDLELLDENGKKLDGAGGGTSDQIIISSAFVKPEKVKAIRVKYYPKIHRIIWTIPELPGLPEENRNLQNLFDARIPFMRFQYEWNYQENLKQLVAMDMDHFPLQYPNGYFPLIRTNFTPRNLLKEIEAKLPNQQLAVDNKKNRIEARRPPWEILIEKVKKMVGK